MSVLNQSGEEQVECPLCMEPLEVDDLNFFPCTCGYQICRFCWHRIRTDENGLCPACRKAYSENPADFTPLSKEQVAQLKAEKRQRDQQRKAKLSESRKHLASVRVVQRNLVFVVGLPLRLADAEVLKKHEYFGKFGKIHKVVINQSTSYAGSQGPSASAYVTYMKSDDALRAIQSVNNINIDGRQIKSSLGTTKYCSHFMKNQPCPKPDCMYLHDFGDPEASFTKEQMHAGKHQEYEKKLHEALNNRAHQQQTSATQQQIQVQTAPPSDPAGTNKAQSTAKSKETSSTNSSTSGNRDSWPQLSEKLDKMEKKAEVNKQPDKEKTSQAQVKAKNKTKVGIDVPRRPEKKLSESSSKDASPVSNGSGGCSPPGTKLPTSEGTCSMNGVSGKLSDSQPSTEKTTQSTAKSKESSESDVSSLGQSVDSISSCGSNRPTLPLLDDNTSFFSSQNSFQKIVPDNHQLNEEDLQENGDIGPVGLGSAFADALPDISSTEDWEAAFGFSKSQLRSPGHQQIAGNASQTSVKDTLDSFGNNFGCSLGSSSTQLNNRLLDQGYSNSKLDMFGSRVDSVGGYTSHRNNYEVNESLLEALTKNNISSYGHQLYKPYSMSQQQNHMKDLGSNGLNGLNGMEHNMTKFFSDFYKNGQKDVMFGGGVGMGLSQQNGMSNQQAPLNGLSNGLNGVSHHHQQSTPQSVGSGSYLSIEDKHALLLMQHQRQISEQLMNLNLQHKQQQQHGYGLSNGLHGSNIPYMNGSDLLQNGAPSQSQSYASQQLFSGTNSMLSSQPQTSKVSGVRHPEDELDFDPILETQKALAEMIQKEQQNNIGVHNTTARSSINSSQPINGMVHNQNNSNSHCPPPPGFVQPTNSNLNSFVGSKILPFLNVGSSQQQAQINNPSPQNSWPSNFGQMPQQQQHKPIGVCNDWKLIDPAIVRSSKQAFPISNMAPLRDQFNPLLGMQTLQNGPQTGPFDTYTGNGASMNSFSNFSQQLQQQNYIFLNSAQTNQAPQNSQLSNWLGASDMVGPQQISSPPGFRNTQTAQGKQQEC